MNETNRCGAIGSGTAVGGGVAGLQQAIPYDFAKMEAERKQYADRELRAKCVDLAINASYGAEQTSAGYTANLVDRAEAFYDFITNSESK